MHHLRYLPLQSVHISQATKVGAAGYLCEVTGTVGGTGVRLEILLSCVSSGSWYLAEPATPPCVWLGRMFAAKA